MRTGDTNPPDEERQVTAVQRRALVANGRSFVYAGGRVYLDTTGIYRDGSPAVRVIDRKRSPVATLTVFLVNEPPPHELYVWVKTWSENENIARAALESGLFLDSGIRSRAGFAEAQAWQFNMCQDVEDAAERLGIRSFDTALPQGWVDEVRRRTGFSMPGSAVWSYDNPGAFGKPAMLTLQAEEALSAYLASLKKERGW